MTNIIDPRTKLLIIDYTFFFKKTMKQKRIQRKFDMV